MFHRMTEAEIAIRRIRDLRMVAVYEFTEATSRDENRPHGTDPERDGCTAVTVLHGDNEQLTMSELDQHYEDLVARLFELYSQMDDTDQVLMNAKTRELFDSGRYTEEAHYQRAFAERESVAMPAVPFDSLRIRMFLPLAEYVLKSCCELLNRKASIVTTRCGWRGRGSITMNSRGTDTLHPVEVTRIRDGEYRIRIGDWPEPADAVRIDFVTDSGRVDVAFATTRGRLSGRFGYHFSENGVEALYEATHEDTQIYYDRETFPGEPFDPEVFGETVGLLPEGFHFPFVYRLPWGVLYTVAKERSSYRDVVKTDYCSVLLFEGAGYSETLSWTIVNNAKSQVVLRKNSVRMERARLSDGRYQTFFVPEVAGASGIYKNKLAGKYFLTK